MHTDTSNIQNDLWTHDLVPPIDHPDKETRIPTILYLLSCLYKGGWSSVIFSWNLFTRKFPATGAAEGMREAGIRREEALNCGFLEGGGTLGEEVDDGGDLFHCTEIKVSTRLITGEVAMECEPGSSIVKVLDCCV